MSELLPLFPLKAVLFPGMLLPLHVFEPRYGERESALLRELLARQRARERGKLH